MKKLLKISEVADFLGLETMSVYGLVARKKIPCLKISRKILRFDPTEIEKFIEGKKQGEEKNQIIFRREKRKEKKMKCPPDMAVRELVEKTKKEVGINV